MVAWVAMNVTDTALLGHSSKQDLNAQALQSLWTSSTGVFLSARVLNIFGSQAYGAQNFHLVGVWAQVAGFVLSFVAIAVVLLWAATGPVLLFSQLWGHPDTEKQALVWPAWYYALVLGTCLPARMLCGILNQFLQCQGIMYPSVVASLVAVVANVCLGLVFVLGIPFNPNPWGSPRAVPAPAFMPAVTSNVSQNGTGGSLLRRGFGFWSCPVVTSAME